MSATAPLVLPSDVSFVAVEGLDRGMSQRLAAEAGDVAVSRRRSRTRSKVVDRDTAELLQEFRLPKTIVEAIIDFSLPRGRNPEKTLEEALPIIRNLVAARLLVVAGSDTERSVEPSLGPRSAVRDFRITRVVQVFEDTEVYQAKRAGGDVVAIKLARSERPSRPTRKIDHEASMLRRLDGEGAPQLIAEGELDGRAYIAVEWHRGVAASVAAGELRRNRSTPLLLDLCGEIVRRYANLHSRGVVHGDVHPHNVLVDASGRVTLVDFGLARTIASTVSVGRGGVGFFHEPEYARALLDGVAPPPPTPAGEQYAVGALLYYLVTGAHYCDFRLERTEMLRQIVSEAPLPFGRHGAREWAEAEAVIAKALAKAPGARYGSMTELAEALAAVPRRDLAAAPGPRSRRLERAPEELIEAAAIEGPLLTQHDPPAPTSSVGYGAAGIALALYRIAVARGDAALLSLSDVWSTRAGGRTSDEGAFACAEIGITPEVTGPVSPWHTASGVHWVQALVSSAMGDQASTNAAIDAFVRASSAPCPSLDLTLGRSGTILACSLLLGSVAEDARLLELGRATAAGVWHELEGLPPIAECVDLSATGIAHGWAGVLYAGLRWCASVDAEVPGWLGERLVQLEDLAMPLGRGAGWPRTTTGLEPPGSRDFMGGWCNGSSGFVHLWLAAHDVLRDDKFARLAELAGWDAWEAPDVLGNLCCGFAGRSYGLLALYRKTRDEGWLRRARDLARRAADCDGFGDRPNSLYKGSPGLAVLAVDIEDPDHAAMPLFEPQV